MAVTMTPYEQIEVIASEISEEVEKRLYLDKVYQRNIGVKQRGNLNKSVMNLIMDACLAEASRRGSSAMISKNSNSYSAGSADYCGVPYRMHVVHQKWQ